MSSLGPIVSVMVAVAVDKPYSYRVPMDMEVTRGSIVSVPLGPRLVLGVVWGEPTDMTAHNRLKDIARVYDVPVLSEELLLLVDWISRYTLAQPGMVLRAVVRSEEALKPLKPITAYRKTGITPDRLTPSRSRVLNYLVDATPWVKSALAEACDVSTSVIDGLIKSGALEPIIIPAPPLVEMPDPDFAQPVFSPAQQKALQQIRAQNESPFAVSLLDGVTGSGKTEIFFEIVADILRQGRQAAIILPEIALTHTFLDRFQKRFGHRAAEWHSEMTPVQKARVWRSVLTGEARVVVGARSALFLPFRELGLLVLDEEHDGAFKQSDRVNYHGRDMAVVRASLAKAKVILSSATPSIESRNNADLGRYAHVRIEGRYADAAMPDVKTVDMRVDGPEKGAWISPLLARAMFDALDRGEQSLLFLNRRGYAPLTLCKSCGHQYQCPHCSTWLVEHRFRKMLMCHHCGHEQKAPTICTECGTDDSLVAVGPGIERIAEEVAERFPTARTVVLSSDMGSMSQIRQRFLEIARGEHDIIIGTQLVAKGHHFEKLSLVGVVDADLGLAHGDPRAAEKTFQVLTQVTGRAGRASKTGKAILQTYHPDHAVMQAMVKGDREAFYAHEIKVREQNQLPPFGRLAALIISGTDHAQTMGLAKLLLAHAPHADAVKRFGPADAPVAMVKERFRVRILVQSPKDFDLSGYVRFWLEHAEKPKGNLRIQVDIDPMSFY